MKKLLGGLLLVISVYGGLWAAACSDTHTLKFSDTVDGLPYPLSVIREFATLKNLLEDLDDDGGAIPVPGTKQQFDLLVSMLDNPNAIPAGYNYEQVVDLLKIVIFLNNKKIQDALTLKLFKKLNQLAAPERQEAFKFIAGANKDIFRAYLKTLKV